MNGVTLVETGGGIRVRVPMKLKKRNGRKEIIVPEGMGSPDRPRLTYQEAIVIAIARGHRWMELLESGKFETIVEMADKFGLCPSYMARLMRFTCLAPDIIESILRGDEPSGFSLTRLIGRIPVSWNEQRKQHGFTEWRSS